VISHIVAVHDSSTYVIEVNGQRVGMESGSVLSFQGDVTSPVHIYPYIPTSTVEEPVNQPAPPLVHHRESVWSKLWTWIIKFLR
jgi:hypothetical protein